MSLIRNDNILFYHPLDSDTEYTQSFDWTKSSKGIFDTGIIVSGFTQSDSTYGNIKGSKVGGGYDDLENHDHFAIAFWSSGFYGASARDDRIEIGFTDSEINIRNGVRYSISEIVDSPTIRLIKRGGSTPDKTIPVYPSVNGWHLTIVDFSKQGSVWQYLVSINGSGWQNVGSGSIAELPDANTNCIIYLNMESFSDKFYLDEVAIWAGHDIFTDDELSNLYELINTYDQPMNQYSSIFATPVNSGVNLFIHGYADSSGNAFLYIPSQKEIKSIDLFTEGSTQTSGNINLYMSGTPTIASSLIDLFITAPTPSSGDANLYIIGPSFESGSINNFINGYNVSSGNVNEYIQGFSSNSGNVNLYMSGIPGASTNLYISGPILLVGSGNDFIWGHMTASGNYSLVVMGRSEDISAFIAVSDNNPSDDLNLFIHGVPSGQSTTFYTNDSATLFIKDDNDDTLINNNWLSFVRVIDDFSVPYDTSWVSFVRGGNTTNNNIGLYTNSHASGEAPRGTLNTSSLTMFVAGQATQSGDEGLLSDDYSVINTEISAFTKVYFGLNDTVNLYVSGAISVVSLSSTLDLFVLGIIDVASSSHTLYIPVKQSINDSGNLFVLGIQGTPSGSCPLYIKVTNIGLFNQENTLYSHGY